ncbi:Mitochondrial enolase superfamily member 1 [Lamellibrachia satsuma]|nr:Mitochondrial enolase superfamily member 1 [Lamellibrachia satsuma]
MGYSDEKVVRLCKEALADGFKSFKVKVGVTLEDDMRRLALVRREIGDDNKLMVDANQIWDIDQAIEWMKPLAKYNLTWIEEPTSPDDIQGHAKIAKALKPLGIGVATGEHCHNRVMFKQFLQADALQFCQIDSCRLAGPNEIISVLLMAAKFGVPVCPHAGGVGLCEMVQHVAIFDYICVSKTREDRVLEYVDHLHEHFVHPVIVKGGNYHAPAKPGYCTEMKAGSLDEYEYPRGSRWQKLFADGLFK